MESIRIMGTDISYITPDVEMDIINEILLEPHAHYVTYTNVHVIVTAEKDAKLKAALRDATIVSPDGMPVVWAAKIMGYQDIEKCSGPDMMEIVLKSSLKNHQTHFFYGSTAENLNSLRKSIEGKYPGIRIAGMHSPPFRALSEKEDRAIIEEINRLTPDFIWVGLGAPKQEIWMHEHADAFRHGVMFGVGAAFNFMSGAIKRAPRWMQALGLEWLHRLVREPRKLWRRYLSTNTIFMIYLIRMLFSKNKRKMRD